MSWGHKGISEQKKQRIKQLRAGGMTMKQVAEEVGVSICTVRWHCNEQSRKYTSKRRKERRDELSEYRKCLQNVKFDYVPQDTIEQAQRLFRQIPPDTRDLTGRLLGDPIPGRSALDRMQSQ